MKSNFTLYLRPRCMSALARSLIAVALVVFGGASAQTRLFTIDSYSLEFPSSWTHKVQPSPDGNQLQMFMGPQRDGAMAYCHTTEQPLQATLSPRASKMNDKQRVEFFANSEQTLLFSVYSNLATAPGFRLLHSGPSVIGKSVPGFTADFVFRVPQGFVYRVRAHYTFWRTAQLSIWCQTASLSEGVADSAFHLNLADFQRLIASVKVKQ